MKMCLDLILSIWSKILQKINCCFLSYIDFFFRNILCLTFLKMFQYEGLLKKSSSLFFYLFIQVKFSKLHPIKFWTFLIVESMPCMGLLKYRKGSNNRLIPVMITKAKQLFLVFFWFKIFLKNFLKTYKLNVTNLSLVTLNYNFIVICREQIINSFFKLYLGINCKTNFNVNNVGGILDIVGTKHPLMQKIWWYNILNVNKVNIHYRWFSGNSSGYNYCINNLFNI